MRKFLLGFVVGIVTIPVGGVCGGVDGMAAD